MEILPVMDTFDEIEMYLKRAKEDVFHAVNSTFLDNYHLNRLDSIRNTNKTEDFREIESIADFPNNNNNLNKQFFRNNNNFSNVTKCDRRSFPRQTPKGISRKAFDTYSLYWSDDFLRDFQNLVQEEIKSLTDLGSEKEVSGNDNNLSNNNNNIKNSSDFKLFLKEGELCEEADVKTKFSSKNSWENDGLEAVKDFASTNSAMGTNQSTVRNNFIDEIYPYHAMTLPDSSNTNRKQLLRSDLRNSILRRGGRDSCELLSVRRHRFSRSLSFEDNNSICHNTSPWAIKQLQTINNAHESTNRKSDCVLPQCRHVLSNDSSGKYESGRVSFISNDNCNSVSSFPQDIPAYKVRKRSSSLDSQDYKFFRDIDSNNRNKEISVDIESTCSSERSLCNEHSQKPYNGGTLENDILNSLPYIEDDSISDDKCTVSVNSNISPTAQPNFSNTHKHNSALTSNVFNGSKTILCPRIQSNNSTLSSKQSSVIASSPSSSTVPLLLSHHKKLVGEEHKVTTECLTTLKSPEPFMITPNSWANISPDEEMIIMENKPINPESNYVKTLMENQENPDLRGMKSLSSSLSSLSQLSLQGDFSEYDFDSPHSRRSLNEDDLLLCGDLSPDVFIDPTKIMKKSNHSEFSTDVTDKALPLPSLKTEKLVKNEFFPNKPVIIKVTPKTPFDSSIKSKQNEEENKENQNSSITPKSVKATQVFDNTNKCVANNSTALHVTSVRQLTGKFRIPSQSDSKKEELIFSINIPSSQELVKGGEEDPTTSISTVTNLVNDEQFNSNSPQCKQEDKLSSINSTGENPINSQLLQTHSSGINESSMKASKTRSKQMPACHGKVKFHHEWPSVSNEKHDRVSKRHKRQSKSRSLYINQDDVAECIFLEEVKNRIPDVKSSTKSGTDNSGLNNGNIQEDLESKSSRVSSRSGVDVFTQTSEPPTPASGSPTLSFTWMSDFAYDRVSLEPCVSSINLSIVEDGLDDSCGKENDEWWVATDQSSSSSVSPETPGSPTADDSSVSFSTSLDCLDSRNVAESGIGTVSTRPSLSPLHSTGQVQQHQDLSGSNLSSEDTGLEISFERRSRRYLPNDHGGCLTAQRSSYYKKRRLKTMYPEFWVRRENQTTQTDPLFPASPLSEVSYETDGQQVRASSEDSGVVWEPTLVSTDHSVRQTHSEPKLSRSSGSFPPELRAISSDNSLPPHSTPDSTVHSRTAFPYSTFNSTSPASTTSIMERPCKLSLANVNMPSKASSAPLLQRAHQYPRKAPELTPSGDFSPDLPVRSGHTQSAKEISEIESIESCKWLRAAGFPQYAQMYEDFQFPLDLVSVERDHLFLDADSIQALFRRLRILNRCAKVRLDSSKQTNGDDSDDEEEECALSGNWRFQSHSRRWSRIDSSNLPSQSPLNQGFTNCGGPGVTPCIAEVVEDSQQGGHFKRSGSQRLKSGAKALLRRMESMKQKKQRRSRDTIVISSPKIVDEALMQGRIKELACVDVSPEVPAKNLNKGGKEQFLKECQESSVSSQNRLSLGVRSHHHPSSEDSSSATSDLSHPSEGSTSHIPFRRRKRPWRKGLTIGGDVFSGGEWMRDSGFNRKAPAFSDSECSPPPWRHFLADTKTAAFDDDVRASPSPDNLHGHNRCNLRHSTSLNYGPDYNNQRRRDHLHSGSSKFSSSPSPQRINDSEAEPLRLSIYDNVPLVIYNKTYLDYHSEGTDPEIVARGSASSECTIESQESPLPTTLLQEELENRLPITRVAMDRWHSFNRSSSSLKSFSQLSTQITGFSVGQMNHLRKRALLKLTALMERFCPSNRTTWNWELPKFIRKIKSPDYKDRSVFGVPLQVINQRYGDPLPVGIQSALIHLRSNCIDQVGIFRKPGVRSRIQKLRDLHENEEEADYFSFGTCDIADMVKTYFRELPEVLLTNKLSEIFIAICQYLPNEYRLEALQCVMLMMPDENREVLMVLLTFLSDVASNSHLNQMTASNLAVCMAPSLFQLNTGTSGVSPLRRKTPGSPEQKELYDNKAAHQCLTLMIQQVSALQCVPTQMLSNCRFSFLDLSRPLDLNDLGSAWSHGLENNWTSFMNACVESLMKETREKLRGWVNVNHPDPLLEASYRKVGDGHPLRLWRVTTDVEAPPTELMNRILRERHYWDEGLLKWRVVSKLSRDAEVFQFMSGSMPPRPPLDFCVLRCWRTDPVKGVCIVVETSIEHPDAPVVAGCVRGVVLASRYLIQPCGSGKSRVTHISRVDMRGRLPEWYNKNFVHRVADHLIKLRTSFRHFANGPESNV